MDTPAIVHLKALTRDGTKISSRLNLDLLRDVLVAKQGDLFIRPPFEWAA